MEIYLYYDQKLEQLIGEASLTVLPHKGEIIFLQVGREMGNVDLPCFMVEQVGYVLRNTRQIGTVNPYDPGTESTEVRIQVRPQNGSAKQHLSAILGISFDPHISILDEDSDD